MFKVFHYFLPYSMSYSVCFSFHTFFCVSRHISCPTKWLSPFSRCQFSHHIPGPTVCKFHFSIFSMFLAIFQVMQCFVSFSTFFFSCLAKIQVLHSIFLSISCIPLFLSKFQVLQSVLLILHIFQWFLPYFMSYHVSFSFSSIVRFLTIFQDLHCEFLIFLVGEFYRHIPGSTVGISHFSRFSLFLAIFHVIQCLCLIFHVFQFFHHI